MDNTINVENVIDNNKRNNHGLSFKDVQLSYMLHGLDAVKNLFLTKKVSGKVLEHAAADLAATGKAEDFVSWVKEAVIVKNTASAIRGRGSPKSGNVREYKVQLVGKKGSPFIRLPIPNGSKGQRITVTFNSDETITISKA